MSSIFGADMPEAADTPFAANLPVDASRPFGVTVFLGAGGSTLAAPFDRAGVAALIATLSPVRRLVGVAIFVPPSILVFLEPLPPLVAPNKALFIAITSARMPVNKLLVRRISETISPTKKPSLSDFNLIFIFNILSSRRHESVELDKT